MFLVYMLMAVHLVAACLLVTSRLRPVRLCDLPIQCLLTAFTSFYGLPIIIGVVTGYINSYTLLFSAAVALVGGVGAKLVQNDKFPYVSHLIKQVKSFYPIAYVLAAVIGLVVVIALFACSALPVRLADAVGYHIVGPMRWVQTGKFTLAGHWDPAVNNYYAQAETFPNVKGILPYVIMLWTGSIAGTAIAQWPFLCLLITALYALYRRLGLSHTVTLVAILFAITAPEILLQGLDSYADVVYFASAVSVVWIILRTVQDGASWTSIIIAAMGFAQLAGSKPVGLLTCTILGLFYLIAVGWVATGKSYLLTKLGKMSLALSLVVVACLAVAGPWYLRGLLVYGNPIYPVRVTILGKGIFPGYIPPNANAGMVEYYTKRTGISAWWGSLSEEWRPPTAAPWSGGLGAGMFIVGLPSIALFLLLLPFLKRSTGTIYIVVVFVVLLATSPAPYLGRFWLLSLGFAGLALGALLMFFSIPLRAVFGFFIVSLCGYNLYVTGPSILFTPRPSDLILFSLFSGSSRSSTIDCYPDDYTAINYWVDKVARDGDRIAVNIYTPSWYLFDPTVNADVIHIHEGEEETIEQWVDRAISAEATHVYVPRSSKLYEPSRKSFKLLQPLFLNSSLRGSASRSKTVPVPTHGALYEIVQ